MLCGVAMTFVGVALSGRGVIGRVRFAMTRLGGLAVRGMRIRAVRRRIIAGRPQEKPGADPATKADQGKKNGKKLADHDQNGSTISAACWP
jgi:hypothetical protein